MSDSVRRERGSRVGACRCLVVEMEKRKEKKKGGRTFHSVGEVICGFELMDGFCS